MAYVWGHGPLRAAKVGTPKDEGTEAEAMEDCCLAFAFMALLHLFFLPFGTMGPRLAPLTVATLIVNQQTSLGLEYRQSDIGIVLSSYFQVIPGCVNLTKINNEQKTKLRIVTIFIELLRS